MTLEFEGSQSRQLFLNPAFVLRDALTEKVLKKLEH
jgi:hypothetical protein